MHRVPNENGLSFAEPMDATYNVQVWQGSHWVVGECVLLLPYRSNKGAGSFEWNKQVGESECASGYARSG